MRLIDADTAAAFAENCGATFVAKRLRDSNAFPEVVTRCKDCKHFNHMEDAQAEVQELRRVNAALTEQISQMNGEAITRENVIANLKADNDLLCMKVKDTEVALGRANAELGAAEGALGEMIELRAKLSDAEEKKEKMNATLADCRVTLAQEVEKRKDWERRSVWQFNHPWRNLWAWGKRKLGHKA